jgi:tetratricopeptide (TPR) repeat protein
VSVKARLTSLAAALLLAACAPAEPPKVPGPPSVVQTETQVITPDEGTTLRELRARGERALREQRWKEAADAFQTLLAAAKVVDDPQRAVYLLDLGLATEALGDRARARDAYAEVAQRFPLSADARTALLRGIAVDDYLEDWPHLGEAGAGLLARPDLDDVDRLTGLGARALAHIEAGDDVTSMRDIQEGLDVVDRIGFGATGRLPNGAAQLRFALAEVRRVRSERTQFTPASTSSLPTPIDPRDFLLKIEMRCTGLLEAQSAYTDAMRAMEPHWTAMSAYRIGVMYGKLHEDLMAIPPTAQAKTDSDRQLFFAMMHVRYRVLLEKGLEMMKRTANLETQTTEVGPWIERARAAQAEMEKAIADEKALLAKLPYSEETVEGALKDLEKRTLARQAKEAKAQGH